MYQKILVPLDGSELSECTLLHVRTIAMGCQVPEVILLRVVEPYIPTYTEASSIEMANKIAKELTNAGKAARKEAENYLAKAAANLKKEGIAARSTIVSSKIAGKAADEILDYAKENQVDLIVMSTHGRSGISRWALGSVADRVIRHSKVPVFIVPPAGCRIDW